MLHVVCVRADAGVAEARCDVVAVVVHVAATVLDLSVAVVVPRNCERIQYNILNRRPIEKNACCFPWPATGSPGAARKPVAVASNLVPIRQRIAQPSDAAGKHAIVLPELDVRIVVVLFEVVRAFELSARARRGPRKVSIAVSVGRRQQLARVCRLPVGERAWGEALDVRCAASIGRELHLVRA